MSILDSIARRAMIETCAVIHIANTRPTARPTDPKVGGHPAACSSAAHILTSLHCSVREPQDFICCKPHAAPTDHAFHHALGLLRHTDGSWFDEGEIGRASCRERV